MSKLEKLFSPVKIGSMEIKNRIAMAPMTVDYANTDETPSDRQIDYYAERARGGTALIRVEVTTVDRAHRYQQHSLGLHNDDLIPGHKKLVDAVHAHGAKIQPQLAHTGPESLSPFYEGIEPLGASVIRTQTTKQACREASVEELEAIIEMYGEAARRTQEAGYDGLELHAAHSYMLLGSFLSPLRNFRQDEYAGHKFDGRAKLVLQVIEKVRKTVGPDFPITLRVSGFEKEAGGREINDTQRLAPLLVAAGVDCFDVSGGVGDANITQIITGAECRPGYNLGPAIAIKQVVDVPVMLVGQNMDPAYAESLLRDGKVDVIAMGRALLADPELPMKASQGNLSEINRCTLCQDCIDIMMTLGAGVKCAVNPRCGSEAEFPPGEAKVKKKVLVIGGGPGGLAAAQFACERGHQVTLMEKQSELGGAFRWASTVFPHNQVFLDYLINQVESLPIEIKLGQEATDIAIKEMAPDTVIVATGARVDVPEIPGGRLPHVISGAAIQGFIQDARGVEEGQELSIEGPVAIIGANLIGIELAEFIARRGKEVRLLEPSGRFAVPVGKKRRGDHAKRLDLLGVSVNTGVAIEEITAEAVKIRITDGSEHAVKAKSVFVVGTPLEESHFLDSVRGAAAEVYGIGDCTGFGLSRKAVHEAMSTIYKL